MAHRFRRNFELTPPLTRPGYTDPPTGPSIASLEMLGLVINPKTKEPVLAVTDGEYIGIRSLREESLLDKLGRGYLADKREHVVEFTGYPRSHTPEGVTIKGRGYGTSLYTAIGLGVHLTYEDLLKITMWKKSSGWYDGISSETDGRSVEADRWWEAARRIGLTETEHEEEEEIEEHVDVDVDADDLNSVVSLDKGKITYVNRVNVDITESRDNIFDVYPYSSVEEHHLVAVTFPTTANGRTMKDLCHQLQNEPDVFSEPDQIALLALDVRGLSVDAVTLITLAYLAADLGDKEIDALQYRWAHDLDPGTESPQLRLFTPNQKHEGGLDQVIAARRASGWAELTALP